MDIRIICVGDELLTGDTINTNLAFIGDRLAQLGLSVQTEICVPDDEPLLLRALQYCDSADLVILVGGLGPTRDDLTRPVVAQYLGRPLRLDPAIRDGIIAYLGIRATNMPSFALDAQAQVPEGAQIMANRNGTAPGLIMRQKQTTWALLPGPPRELIPMFNNELLPAVLPGANPEWEAVTMHVCGMPETPVERLVRETLGENHGLHLAFCIKQDNIMVRISRQRTTNCPRLLQAVESLRVAFGHHLAPANCNTAAEYLGTILTERQLTLATAESCTGGGLAAALTEVPGASAWFPGALVTYANDWKTNLLKVPAEVIAKHGAVSEQTVNAMLDGVLQHYHTDLAIATSGIAGPSGGTAQKPVGTVVIGVAHKSGAGRQVQTYHFNGQREAVRARTVSTAINMTINNLLKTNYS